MLCLISGSPFFKLFYPHWLLENRKLAIGWFIGKHIFSMFCFFVSSQGDSVFALTAKGNVLFFLTYPHSQVWHDSNDCNSLQLAARMSFVKHGHFVSALYRTIAAASAQCPFASSACILNIQCKPRPRIHCHRPPFFNWYEGGMRLYKNDSRIPFSKHSIFPLIQKKSINRVHGCFYHSKWVTGTLRWIRRPSFFLSKVNASMVVFSPIPYVVHGDLCLKAKFYPT